MTVFNHRNSTFKIGFTILCFYNKCYFQCGSNDLCCRSKFLRLCRHRRVLDKQFDLDLLPTNCIWSHPVSFHCEASKYWKHSSLYNTKSFVYGYEKTLVFLLTIWKCTMVGTNICFLLSFYKSVNFKALQSSYDHLSKFCLALWPLCF